MSNPIRYHSARKENRDRGMYLLECNQRTAAHQAFSKGVEVTPDMAYKFIQVSSDDSVSVLVLTNNPMLCAVVRLCVNGEFVSSSHHTKQTRNWHFSVLGVW